MFEEISELAVIQNALIQMLPTLKRNIQEGGIDISYLAKSFGAGALISFNPFMGIPAIIALFGDKIRRQKQTEIYLAEFYKKYQEYITKIAKLDEGYIASMQSQVDPLSGQLQIALLSPILHATEHLDRNSGD